jgi:hypothetical protein
LPSIPAPPWRGGWSHPWLFTLLSCVRNPNNPPERREDSLKQLLEESSQWVQKYKVESLFGLFDAAYRLFDAVYRQRPQDEARRVLLAWLKAQAQAGFPGWREHLMPLIHEDMDREAVEALCDAIRYH